MHMNKVALFITYTMVTPVVGGAFMRAVRLATEMAHRGWQCVICNHGPMLQDPKVAAAPSSVRILTLDRERPGLTSEIAAREFQGLDPAIFIMGETPFEQMKLFYEAGQLLNCPFVVLDQFYNNDSLPSKEGVDLFLLYGLLSFWENELDLSAPYDITPPFIEAVTSKRDLPVPAQFHDFSWITFVAYDEYVCKKGIELLSQFKDERAAIIAISSNPDMCRDLARSRGLRPERLVVLPLQDDLNVFGFFAASSFVLVSNGFLQIMEALAMGCPVIALERGLGVGMTELNIDSRFVPYVSFAEALDQQLARMNKWMLATPFSEELLARLGRERHGVSYCADRIEQLYCQWHSQPGPRLAKGQRMNPTNWIYRLWPWGEGR